MAGWFDTCSGSRGNLGVKGRCLLPDLSQVEVKMAEGGWVWTQVLGASTINTDQMRPTRECEDRKPWKPSRWGIWPCPRGGSGWAEPPLRPGFCWNPWGRVLSWAQKMAHCGEGPKKFANPNNPTRAEERQKQRALCLPWLLWGCAQGVFLARRQAVAPAFQCIYHPPL